MSSKVARPQEKNKNEHSYTRRNKIFAGVIAGFLVLAMVVSMIIGALSGIL